MRRALFTVLYSCMIIFIAVSPTRAALVDYLASGYYFDVTKTRSDENTVPNVWGAITFSDEIPDLIRNRYQFEIVNFALEISGGLSFAGTSGHLAFEAMSDVVPPGDPFTRDQVTQTGFQEFVMYGAGSFERIFFGPPIQGFFADGTPFESKDYIYLAASMNLKNGNAGAGTFPYKFELNLTQVNPVPEPATMLLLGAGLVGLAGYSRKKIRK